MIVSKAIKPAKLRQDVFRLEFLSALHEVGREMVRDYQRTTATWEGDKPGFGQAISLAGSGPTLVVEASGGSAKGVQKWNWLDKGTRVRYATMSRDFSPKTSVRFIGSGGGAGKLLFVSQKHPRPGIKAREWSAEMVKLWRPKFRRRMEDAMRTAVQKSGHALQ